MNEANVLVCSTKLSVARGCLSTTCAVEPIAKKILASSLEWRRESDAEANRDRAKYRTDAAPDRV